jgi:hypothetical protein
MCEFKRFRPSLRPSRKAAPLLDSLSTLLFLTLSWQMALAAPDVVPTEMPKSRSPDEKFALYYEPFLQGAAGSPEFTVYFRGPGLARASAQLDPDFGNNYPGKPGGVWKPDEENTFDTQALFNMICRCNEFHLRKRLFDSGFSYSVMWTPDSKWVAMEGGAHKFWHMVAYHFEGGEFRQVDLAALSSQIDSYFSAQMPTPTFQELGINKGITAKWGDNHESHYVIWLGDGRFAVLGYPFLVNNGHFNSLREKGEIFFLVDCRDPRHPVVTGMAH